MPQAVTNDLWNKRQRAGIVAPRAQHRRSQLCNPLWRRSMADDNTRDPKWKKEKYD